MLPLAASFPLCILFRWSFCRLARAWILWKVPWISWNVSRTSSLTSKKKKRPSIERALPLCMNSKNCKIRLHLAILCMCKKNGNVINPLLKYTQKKGQKKCILSSCHTHIVSILESNKFSIYCIYIALYADRSSVPKTCQILIIQK